MFSDGLPLDRVSELIRLALTPVFLIAAVSSMLGVLTSRLARVADQALSLNAERSNVLMRAQRSVAIGNIEARAWLLLAAMALCVVCTLLVTVVISLLYWAHRGTTGLSRGIGLLFVLSIAVLALAMLCLLAEVGLSSVIARILLRDLRRELQGQTAAHGASDTGDSG
jgi:hypothetical protein